MFRFIEVSDRTGRRLIAVGHIIALREEAGSRTVITLTNEDFIDANEHYGQVRELIEAALGLGI